MLFEDQGLATSQQLCHYKSLLGKASPTGAAQPPTPFTAESTQATQPTPSTAQGHCQVRASGVLQTYSREGSLAPPQLQIQPADVLPVTPKARNWQCKSAKREEGSSEPRDLTGP